MAHSGSFIHRSLSSLWTYAILAAIVAVGLYAASASQAASVFLVRGDIVKYDKTNGQFHVYIRHTNSAAEKYAGQIREINANGATFFKYDAKQNKVRSTYGTTIDNIGPEVVVRGTVDDSDQFRASWVVRNDNTVRLRGTVRGQDADANYLEIELDAVQFQATHKPYKTKRFKQGDTVLIHYQHEGTKFISRDGNTMNEDEISNNDEKITVETIEVRHGSRFVGENKTVITDGKWKF